MKEFKKDLKKEFNTEAEHLWHLGKNKDATGMTWAEIADTMNKAWRSDEDEYYTESAYRKRYTMASEMFESVIKPEMEHTMKDAKSYAEEIRKERELLYGEKVRMWDARRAYNKSIRDVARHRDTLELIMDELKRQAHERYGDPEAPVYLGETDNDLLCCLSDIHYGIEFDSHTGKYNSEIAKSRIMEYANKIIQIGERHGSQDVYVTLLGDQLSGIIHPSIQIENRENIIQQVMGVSGIISDFVFILSQHFSHVYVNGVAGNHSRIQPKDVAVKDERLDNLIIWHLHTKFTDYPNITVTPYQENLDSTVAEFIIRDKRFLSVHGDYDPFTDSAMAKFVLWLGEIPYAVLSGHMHTPSFKDVSTVMCIQSGSLCGSGDNYTVGKRLRGYPSQTVVVVTDDGIDAMYPVRLN